MAVTHVPTTGGDLVRLDAPGFGPGVTVRFGERQAEVLGAHDGVVEVRAPAHDEGLVDVTLTDDDGRTTTLPGAVRYVRAQLAPESDLTRLVRTLLRELKRQVHPNVTLSVSADFDDTPEDRLDVVAIAMLPSLVLTGPRVVENRFYSVNEVRPEPAGEDVLLRRPPYTVDLAFTLTGASDRATELLNLVSAVGAFLHHNRWIAMPRDPADPQAGLVRWEMDPDGDVRTKLDNQDDVRAFTAGLVIRGFDLDQGQRFDVTRPVAGEPEVHVHDFDGGDL